MNRFSRLAIVISTLALAASPMAATAAPTQFRAHLSGSDEVPVRDTHATGQAQFAVNGSSTEIQFRLVVSNIENVTAANLYLGGPGATGELVATLYGPVAPGGGKQSGVLATGTIAGANLTGSLAGHPLSDLIDAMRSGNVFVNVLTDDGQGAPDEKPGDFSTGEIRGQIR